MKYDSAPRIDPVLNLARDQMAQVPNIHVAYLAIVSGRDETKVVQFDAVSFDRMINDSIPYLIDEIDALGVILSSPTRVDGRYGAVVTLIDRMLEAFYVPIVRITNADPFIGDFRPTDVPNPELYARIREELCANWAARED
jgi:hypothetical protein